MELHGVEKANIIWGFIATLGAAVFGQYWMLFAGFLLMNIIDYATGWWKSKYYSKDTSSVVGAKGIAKKVFYWVVIGISFYVARCFADMGRIIGIDLSFVSLFGWFTLASYLVNELRSILENLVEMHVNVPVFLIKGLDVTQKIIKSRTDTK